MATENGMMTNFVWRWRLLLIDNGLGDFHH